MNTKLHVLFLVASFTIACGEKRKGTISNGADTNSKEDTNLKDTYPNTLYPECTSHSDCAEDQFCGIECWTGGCGENSEIEANTMGQYCQPCVECEQDDDSITGDCSICE